MGTSMINDVGGAREENGRKNEFLGEFHAFHAPSLEFNNQQIKRKSQPMRCFT